MVAPSVRFAVAFAVLSAAVPSCNRPVDTKSIENPSSCAEQGVKVCRTACEAGDAAACLVASVATRDRDQMMAYEKQACDGGVAQGCRFYGNSFGPSRPTPDMAKVRKYYGLACDGEDTVACVWLIRDALGSTDDGDDHVMRDPAAARERWAKWCEWEPGACAGLGDLEMLGVGGPKDVEAARAHYAISCEVGNDLACASHDETDPRVWLQSPNWPMLGLFRSPDPNFAFEGAMPGQLYDVEIAACFTRGPLDPVSTEVVRASESPAVDQAVKDNIQFRWKARVREPFPEDYAGCLRARFRIQNDPHVNM